nr:uncharacterized protein I203_01987 [Kwoniella mangroviensis CBS 8507]OCF68604.1 hypothetical protein I203_01987 [Kwoniella mangroviensis CBS 8507]
MQRKLEDKYQYDGSIGISPTQRHLPNSRLSELFNYVKVLDIDGPRLYAIPEGQCTFTEPVLEALRTIKSLTILFEPSTPSPIMGKAPMASNPSLFNVSFISSITKCVNIDTPVHIVNAGYIQKIRHRGSTKSIERSHQESMRIIKGHIELTCKNPYADKVGWSKSNIQKRKDNLIFQTMEGWTDSGEWEGKMKAEEVMRWRSVMSKVLMW